MGERVVGSRWAALDREDLWYIRDTDSHEWYRIKEKNNMRKTRWLHISDIHFAYSDYHPEKAKENFLKKLKEFKGKVEYLLISGDLRYGKLSPNKYPANAVECIKNDIMDVLGVQQKNVLIVPGNHDVDRGRKRDRVLADVLKEYDSNKGEINKEDKRDLKDTQKNNES